MGDFSGSEPLVGEIVGLRTFRIEDSGLLLPLYSNGAWYNGANTAECAPPTGHHPRGPHPVPDPACECGFYAYGTGAAAEQNRQSRYVRAVVSCWGGVVAGTKGIRAEHARIDALWINPAAPTWLRRRVAARYPSARMYADPDAMLAEHPLTELPCYGGDAPRRVGRKVVATVGGAALLTLGLLPFDLLHDTRPLWTLWLAIVGVVALFAGWMLVGSHGAGHVAAAFVIVGVLGWLVAPVFGLPGWLLRVPVLRGLAVGMGGYLVALRPRHFPVVRNPKERAFCGVRA